MPGNSSPLEIGRADADALESDREWWGIYQDSFPAPEREPPEVILSSVRSGIGVALRARSAGRTVGIATIHLLKVPPAVFLVYLAVAPGRRGGGIGSALFEAAWAAGQSELKSDGLEAVGMVWEVDIPPTVATNEEGRNRLRRARFFRRQGGIPSPHPYFQPPVDGVRPVPMLLMFRPAAGAAPGAAGMEPLVRSMYFEKYGAANGIPLQVLRALLDSQGGS